MRWYFRWALFIIKNCQKYGGVIPTLKIAGVLSHPSVTSDGSSVDARFNHAQLTALGSVDPTPYFQKYGQNVWAGVKGYLDAVTELATAPVIAKYTNVLASADVQVFTYSTTFMILQSMRLDLGAGSQVHP